MSRNKKENLFLLKKGFFFFNNQKRKQQTFIIYMYFFFLEEREGVYFKLKYLLSYLQFFLKLYPKTFLVNQYEQKLLSFVFPITLLFFFLVTVI